MTYKWGVYSGNLGVFRSDPTTGKAIGSAGGAVDPALIEWVGDALTPEQVAALRRVAGMKAPDVAEAMRLILDVVAAAGAISDEGLIDG